MTKRRLIRWTVIFVILAAFAVWLEPTRVVWGWLRGEAFYQGRPTSYWERTLANWDVLTLDTGPNNWLELNFKVRSTIAGRSAIRVQKSAPAFHAESHPDSDRISGALVIESQKNNWVAVVRRWLTKSGTKLEVNSGEPGLLNGDPEAAHVLRVIAEHSVGEARALAEYGLRNIESRTKLEP